MSDVTVPTVRGEIPTGSLGRTLMHEHTFCISPEVNNNFPETWGDEDEHVDNAIGQYQRLKQRGIDTVVDVTVLGLGRYIPRIQRIAAETDLNIIVATGLYIWSDVPMFFACRGPGTARGGPEYITDMLVRDICDGIGDTGVRAAIIKVATHEAGLTPAVTRVLRASAAAHRATGVPITTHTHDAPNGLQQQQVFTEEGVDLSRVVIGHVSNSAPDNLDYVRELIDNGSFVGFDTFKPVSAVGDVLERSGCPRDGQAYRDGVRAAEERNAKTYDAVVTLVNEGHADRIVLSHDHNCYCDITPPGYFDSWEKTWVLDGVVPALQERGVSEEQIDTMLRANARRVFETAARGAY
jgi:phosphotriesterase-related protein